MAAARAPGKRTLRGTAASGILGRVTTAFALIRRTRTWPALLGLAYLAFGWLWISFSDQAGRVLFSSSDALTRFQTYKGFAFVAFSALVFYFAVSAMLPEEGAPAAASGRGTLSVRAMLTLLVLVTALPMGALLGWNISRETSRQTDAATAMISRIAGDEAAEVGALLQSQVRVASTLAQRPLVRLLDPSRCDPLLGEVGLVDTAVAQVAIYDARGHLVCGQAGAPADIGTAPPDGRPSMDSPTPGSTAWTFHVSVAIPGEAPGKNEGTVRMTMPLQSLQRSIEGPQPNGGIVAIVDERMRIVVRSPPVAGFTGLKLTRSQSMQVHSRDGQSYVNTGLDGEPRLYAARVIGETGWTAVAGVPLNDVYQPARQAFLYSALGAMAIIAVCGWLVVPLGRRILGPLRALELTANAVAAGETYKRAPETGPAELAAVAAGFNRMLDRLPALEQAVRDSEVHHRTLLDKLASNVPGVIYIFEVNADDAMSLPFVSAGSRDVFELEAAQLRERPLLWDERVHPEDRARLFDAIMQSRRALTFLTIEYRVVLPRAGVRHCLSRSQPERRGDGTTVWYGCVLDITDLKIAQQALQDANDSLERRITLRTAALASANESLEAFTYSVAHDLRAPVQSITGFSQVLARAMREGEIERAKGFNERVLASARQMHALIEGFMALARTGRTPIDETVVDTGLLVAEVLAQLPVPPTARFTVAPLPPVRGDRAMLRQVWSNLLGNAVKYSSRREEAVIDVSWEMRGDEAVFTINDNGAGFDPQYAGKLFSPFYRLHRADEFEGTGVGLAVARRIVESHGGRIWAQGRPGDGAAFSFSLPKARVS